MEGDGPIMGDPRHLGLVAMGTDLIAVDATCARVIGLDPAKLGYLRMASEFLGNLAEDRIEQRGESPSVSRPGLRSTTTSHLSASPVASLGPGPQRLGLLPFGCSPEIFRNEPRAGQKSASLATSAATTGLQR